jgi:hypothetical protein
MQILTQAVRDPMGMEEVEEDCAGRNRGQLVAAARGTAEASGGFERALEEAEGLLEL